MADVGDIVNDVKKIINEISILLKKAEDLEKKKSAGTISEADYSKEWIEINDNLQQTHQKYKSLVETENLPDDLKKKTEELTPVFVELASNDFKTSGNTTKENLDKIKKVFDEVNAFMNSQLQISQIDLEGIKKAESILFLVNGHHSNIIPGPSAGGKEYWYYFDKEHSYQFLKYFNFSEGKTQIIYVDGSSIIGVDEDFKDRFKLGQNYIQKIIGKEGKFQDKNIAIVGHSEGVAYAAGIVEELYNSKATIKEAVYLSGDECAESGAYTNANVPTYQIEYMYFDKSFPDGNCEAEYDWVIGTDHRYESYSGLKGVTKFGIAIQNDLSYQTVHNAGATRVIPFLNDLKTVKTSQYLNSDGKTFYDHSKTKSVNFYKINDIFIYPKHPQFNNKTGEIDYRLPCTTK